MSALVILAARLGSPASEQAAVLAVPRALVLAAGRDGVPLPDLALLERWVQCVTWRYDWRAGSSVATDTAEIEAIGQVAASLPWLPEDWILDHRDALAGYEVVPVEDTPDPWSGRSQRGSHNGRAKLSRDDVRLARALWEEGETVRSLAARFGVGRSAMHRALRGETWG